MSVIAYVGVEDVATHGIERLRIKEHKQIIRMLPVINHVVHTPGDRVLIAQVSPPPSPLYIEEEVNKAAHIIKAHINLPSYIIILEVLDLIERQVE